MPNYAAIILAAGRGERSGRQDGPKQYRAVGGKPVIQHSVETFLADTDCSLLVVVRHADDEMLCNQSLGGHLKKVDTVIGGQTRQDSTLSALEFLAALPTHRRPGYVLIHDAARPFVDMELVQRVKDQLDMTSGVLPAMAVSDTLKQSGQAGTVKATVPRSGLYAAQTPQAFPFDAILAAHRSARDVQDIEFTDDSSIAEWAGLPMKIVEGSPDNTKLTWKRDIDMANDRLSAADRFPDVRTGNGYDVHSFVAGDHVWLGGIKIEHSHGLNGHSDSDVALHALTDALLATCAAGDIGTHFPPSDPQWKGCASSVFIRHAADIIRSKSGRIANVDITLICEAPRIGQHREAMTEAISAMLAITQDRVSIKATTNEKLGFIGRREGIAAIATASVVYPGSVPSVSS